MELLLAISSCGTIVLHFSFLLHLGDAPGETHLWDSCAEAAVGNWCQWAALKSGRCPGVAAVAADGELLPKTRPCTKRVLEERRARTPLRLAALLGISKYVKLEILNLCLIPANLQEVARWEPAKHCAQTEHLK